MLARRLLDFIDKDENMAGLRDLCDDGQNVLEMLKADQALLRGVIDAYKQTRWQSVREGTAGYYPCTSIKDVGRVSRKSDERFLIMAGWHHPEGGLSGFCAYCGIEIQLAEMTIDHVVPRVKGGDESLSNLVPACPDCNREKGDKSVDEFLASIGYTPDDIDGLKREWQAAFEFREQSGDPWTYRLSEHQRGRLGLASDTAPPPTPPPDA